LDLPGKIADGSKNDNLCNLPLPSVVLQSIAGNGSLVDQVLAVASVGEKVDPTQWLVAA